MPPATFTLPISDCNCFLVGELPITPPADMQARYGVIVWYENKETAKLAAMAATEAHWNDEPVAS